MNDVIDLATAADLTARVLREHPDLHIAAVRFGESFPDGVTIALQVKCRYTLDAIVTELTDWAHALDTIVVLTVGETFTKISAAVVIESHAVQVWDHLNPVDTAELFTRLGMPEPTLKTRVEISPDALARTVALAVAVA